MSDEWKTPDDLFNELDKKFHFTLDVCATAENTKCEQFFTKKQNALMQKWVGICWMNPPYSKPNLYKFMKKAYESSLEGATVVCLVPSYTDTSWWHEFVTKGVHEHIKGRLKFNDCDTPARFPNTLVIFYPPNNKEDCNV